MTDGRARACIPIGIYDASSREFSFEIIRVRSFR